MPSQRTSNGAPTPTAPPPNPPTNRQYRNNRRPIREYNPVGVANRTSSGVGLLAAEYFAIVFLLILELFVSTDSYGDKMISTMKRGTLVTLLFFILAMVAGVGPNAAKVAKGLGALVLGGILLSSPGATLIASLDNFIKSDWITSDNSSADTGTQSSQGTAASAASSSSSSITSGIEKVLLDPGFGLSKAIQLPGDVIHINESIADWLKKHVP